MARLGEMKLIKGNRGLLLLAVAAGLVAAALVFVALAQNDDDGGGSVSPGGGNVAVVVAAQDIAAGTKVSEGMLKVMEVPEALALSGAFADSTPIVGQVTRYAVLSGEQITPGKVGPTVKGEGLGYVVPAGKRAVGIQVKEVTAVGGLLLPGDRVDVIAVFEGEGDASTSVITVLQGVEVLAVAQEAQEPVPAADSGTGESDLATSGQLPDNVDTHPNAGTVTVAVDPGQAQLLAGVQVEADEVWLSLVPAGDNAPVDLQKLNVNDIIGQ